MNKKRIYLPLISLVIGLLNGCILPAQDSTYTNPSYSLPSVPIVPQKLLTLGNLKRKSEGSFNRQKFSQIALFFPNEENLTGIIQQVSFYITKEGNRMAPFRVRVYAASEEYPFQPHYDLLTEQVIFTPKKPLSKWVHVNLEPYHVPIPPRGFFVAMDWFDFGNSFFFKTDTPQIGESKQYGQTLGLSVGSSEDFTWLSEGESKRWWQAPKFANSTRNAMIRATVLVE